MRVLSLFDWIACWYEALVRAWIKVDAYYASEIDKYAIQIAQKNHPDIIQIWDVQKIWFSRDELWWWDILYRLEDDGSIYLIDRWPIDLLIGGSPCQWFSVAWKMLNFDDPRSKLFFEFVRILKEVKPKYFLLENVKMKKEWQDIISRELWVEPIEINSSLVSAQSRRRLYWTNIPNVTQPQDKWILLKDILQENVDEEYNFSKERMSWLVDVVDGEVRIKQATKKGYIVAEEWDGISLSFPNSTTRRWRVVKWKANTLVTQWDSYVYDKVIRKLTPIEYERLQTLPDNYTEWVSDTQRYKILGNGRTVDVIAHIFKNLHNN